MPWINPRHIILGAIKNVHVTFGFVMHFHVLYIVNLIIKTMKLNP